jgi:4-hydroxy-tetrahydrodipicolinate reductase
MSGPTSVRTSDEGPLRLAIVGLGRMGRELAALAPDRGFEVVASFDASDPAPTPATLGDAQVAIEFTQPDAAVGNVRALVAAGCPVVVGTTGWYGALPALEREVATRGGAMLWAANFSLGVNLMIALAREAGRLLRGTGFDVHLLETHHAAKKDAPSGTAIVLDQAVREGLGRPVPMTSVRTGHVPGTHALVFDAPFEQLRLEHEARDRRVFAEGALVAARWLVGRRGVFTMRDVLAPRSDTPHSGA